MPDNLMLAAVHNLLHKNSLSSMGEQKHKGITNPDFDAAFRRVEGDDDEDDVAALFEEMSEMEFEKPNLREVRKNIGRDPELFSMLTALVDERSNFL